MISEIQILRKKFKIKYSMKSHDEKITYYIWWKFLPGTNIDIDWPAGYVGGVGIYSADPNEHFRPWLEKNVGRQYLDWDWKMGATNDKITIKFRIGKKAMATAFLLVFR